MQACIRRSVEAAIKAGDSHLVLICVWQKGADALLREYTELAVTLLKEFNNLPGAESLEVLVLSKSDLLKRYEINEVQIGIETTYEINEICKQASAMEAGRGVELYVDECWVTVPQRFDAHNTKVN